MSKVLNRRSFLSNGVMVGCSLAASPLITPVALASAPWDTRLVVILLRGGMDGLDAVQPVGDRDFAQLRPNIGAGEAAGAWDLTGFYAAHRGMEALRPLWRAGELSFVHAVSTPYRDKRSHFDGQDLLEAGISELEDGVRDGWLNRLLQIVPNVTSETAYAVGQERMLILDGPARSAAWSPKTELDLSPQAERLLDLVNHDDPLFREAGAEALLIAGDIAAQFENTQDTDAMLSEDAMMSGIRRAQNHVQLAEFAASRLRGDSRIASFSINGWDTHNGQSKGMERALSHLSDSILTLRAGLGPAWEKTAVVCMTEFGRTVRENGTRGTDHGTGGAMILAGGALNGGRVLGNWPGLGQGDLYADRDLMPVRDVRAYAGWIMRAMTGLSQSQIERTIFPGLDMGADPNLLL